MTLECSSDQANAIRWLYDGAYVTGLGCSPSSANYLTVSSTQNECDLTILSSSTAVLGPYACGDGTAADKIAQAVVILIGNFEQLEINFYYYYILMLKLP